MQRLLLAPKLFYFWYFMASGAIMPYLSLYYREAGLDLAQIGLLAALPGLIQMIAAPVWGMVADALRLHRVMLPLAVVGTLLPVWLIGQVSSFGIVLALVAVQAFFVAPVTPLADNATLTLLGDQRDRYGAQRMWGAIGWGISTLIFGWLIKQSSLDIIFPSYVVLGLLTGVSALLLPGSRLVQVNMREAAGTLLRDRRWPIFLGSVFLIGCASSTIHGFLSLYLQDLGAGSEEIGFAVALASVTEMPVMALAPLALRRWGTRPLMIGAGLLFTVRCLIYAFAPSAEWALFAQLLHGFCFGALWTAGVNEAQRLAPPGLEATAQSLFGTTFFGLASMLANTTGGWLYRDFGYSTLFTCVALVSLAGSIALFINVRLQKAAPVPPVVSASGE